jgi:hypothetical protein
MNISKETLSVIKNFSTINPVIYLGDPDAIRVISPSKAIIGVFQSEEKMDHDCVFWDWPTLLSTLDTMGAEKANLEFEDKFVKITSEDKSSLKYFYTPAIVVSQSNPKPKDFKSYAKEMDTDFEFELSSEVLAKTMKVARVMNLSMLEVTFEDGKGTITAVDDSGKVNHCFHQDIEGKGSGKINIYLNSMNIIPGSYSVTAKTNLFSKWTNKDIPLFYIVAAKKA